jgi:DNA-binding NtrC family response regulator
MSQKTVSIGAGSANAKERNGSGPGMMPPERVMKKAKVLIIDDEGNMIIALRAALGGLCEMPNVPPVCKLADALGLVDAHSPDVIVSDKRFDPQNPAAHLELLDYAKGKNPKTIVILHSADITANDCGSDRHSFDDFLDKGMYNRLEEILLGMTGR